MMRSALQTWGYVLVVSGFLIILPSVKIVFPGLELLLGIEAIVGKENVIYEPDGSYVFTNPGGMVRWIGAVALFGFCIVGGGTVLIWRARSKLAPKPLRK